MKCDGWHYCGGMSRLTHLPFRWVSLNIKSSVAISPRRTNPILRYTACASSRPMMSLPSRDSGISCGAQNMLPISQDRCAHGGYRKLKKVKKANGEIIGVNVVSTYPCYPMQPSRGRRTGSLTQLHIAIASLRLLFAPVMLCDILFFLDSREEAFEGEELWHMDSLRLAFWHTQHVQGIP